MKISLCIPMYNESDIIDGTLRTVSEYMRRTFEDYEVIFCDDGSTDDCRAKVEAFGDERIRAVGYSKNRGKGAAVRHAVMNAVGDIIIFTDCDLAYGLDVVHRVVGEFLKNKDADIVVGSRNLSKDGYEGYTLTRKMASKAYIKCLAFSVGFKMTDSQCGFKAFRLDTAHEIFRECTTDGFAFDIEVLLRAKKLGKKITEMPVKVVNHRQSKVNILSDSIKMLGQIRQIKRQIRSER